MAKIVVLASGKDADAAKAALEAGSIDFEIVDPNPVNLLNLVIGMVDDDSTDPDAKPDDEEGKDKTDKEPKEPKDPNAELDVPKDEDELDVPESIGMVDVDGELVEAVKLKEGRPSILFVSDANLGGKKVSYRINESVFSFWTENDEAKPFVVIKDENGSIHTRVQIQESKTGKSYLGIGDNLTSFFNKK